MKTIIITMLLMLSVSCSSTLTRNRLYDSSIATITDIQVEYVNSKYERLDSSFMPRDIYLEFPVIRGQIFGRPSTKPIFARRLTYNNSFELELLPRGDELDDLALPLQDNYMTQGIFIYPVSTRIARFATYAYNATTEKGLGYGGFIDAESRNQLILVYVDKPCSIKGTVILDDEQFNHDIVFEKAGFQWIEFKLLEKNKSILVNRSQINKISFYILPDDLSTM